MLLSFCPWTQGWAFIVWTFLIQLGPCIFQLLCRLSRQQSCRWVSMLLWTCFSLKSCCSDFFELFICFQGHLWSAVNCNFMLCKVWIEIAWLKLQWNISSDRSFLMYFDVHPSVMCHIKINKNRVDTWFHALVIDQILRCGCCTQKWRQINVNLKRWGLNDWRSLHTSPGKKSVVSPEDPVMAFDYLFIVRL